MAEVDLTQTLPPDNLIQPFQVETLELRGRMVRLGAALDDILRRHDYPYPVAKVLGEALTLTACLANSLKFEGAFRLHAQSDGPVSLIACDVTHDGHLRGYGEYNAAKLNEMRDQIDIAPGTPVSIPRLLGEGHLAFTVDANTAEDRYQGIVDLDGETLTDCVHHYFQQSEQIETVIKMACDKNKEGWRASALMLQRLPKEERKSNRDPGVSEENWRRAVIFLGSSTHEEMLDPALAATGLIYRLFNEDGVRIYKTIDLKDQCTCDKKRMKAVLKGLPEESIEEMIVDGKLTITCQFCKKKKEYDRKKLEKLRS